MDISIHLPASIYNRHITITGSKSETNRLLLLKALYPEIVIVNASLSDDSIVMQAALTSLSPVIDVHHAGTAMRFLTAYFALLEGREVVLTGSERMKQRPVGILVDALITLGADITYIEEEGYPPLRIIGKKISGGTIAVDGRVSSQYISALMLIGGKLESGLEIEILGKATSKPYIDMTSKLLNEAGISTVLFDNKITIGSCAMAKPVTISVESDWSSASYYYSIVALSPVSTVLQLSTFKAQSLQGDSVLPEIYSKLGVKTTFCEDTIVLERTDKVTHQLQLDLNCSPDIAQTVAVTCAGLGIYCKLTGLHTLKIKETDRLLAVQNELKKLGVHTEISEESITVLATANLFANATIETYNDHRMAMAFAPMAVRIPIIIKDIEVVSKSYPDFWEDLAAIGFSFTAISKH